MGFCDAKIYFNEPLDIVFKDMSPFWHRFGLPSQRPMLSYQKKSTLAKTFTEKKRVKVQSLSSGLSLRHKKDPFK